MTSGARIRRQIPTSLPRRRSGSSPPPWVTLLRPTGVLASRAWEALFDDEQLGLQLEHMIHTDQSFNWIRPLHKGDEVTSTLRITSVRIRGNTDIIGIDVSLDHVNGEHLGNATSTLWHTRPEANA